MTQGAIVNNSASTQQLNMSSATTQWLNLTQQNDGQSTGVTLDSLNAQQANLQQQIAQAEQNFNAQLMMLAQQQQVATEDKILSEQREWINSEAATNDLSLVELSSVLDPVVKACTKEAIANGKAWILKHIGSQQKIDVISQYLLTEVTDPKSEFSKQLHIIYLINDTVHHCLRKSENVLKSSLESIIVPMFCSAITKSNEEQKSKLQKLYSLWETKNHYFSDSVMERLKTPEQSLIEYKNNLMEKHREAVNQLNMVMTNTLQNYRSQHQSFLAHCNNQIQTIENQKRSLEQQKQILNPLPIPTAQDEGNRHYNEGRLPSPPLYQNNMSTGYMQSDQPNFPHQADNGYHLDDHYRMSQMSNCMQQPPMYNRPPPPFSQPPPNIHLQPPPSMELPDLSRPPPNFMQNNFSMPPVQPEIVPDDLVPSLPYYELPAGLMVPLVKLEDSKYRPLDPETIRLPPPAPPTERLLEAVKAFYMPPGHFAPRDSDGWEKLGLYEYYKAKNLAKKQKEDDIANKIREKSKSPSPIIIPSMRDKSPVRKKRYRSRSRSPKTRSPSRRLLNKKSPPPTPNRNRRRRSPSKSLSPSPPNTQRSPTPPSFGTGFGKTAQERLDESNKGHQLLKKMGWGGAGLGSKEQGIDTPISSGDIRDRTDQYKGVGISLNDPYENFRKNKGKAFIHRMRTRAEERMEGNV
ncbi:calcium homeostasis endoplasmic reticulum protein isoform X2 [Daktulosphaira vitifoliae]|nr:calcium homeostasis endoplasmic reticulum protein isoform X2 [Daktulosphaira vitifoliae]